MKFKAIIFDLDGTLLNTLEDLADSMNAVLKAHGFPEHEVSAYQYFIGNGIEKLVQRALPESDCDETTLKRAVEEVKAAYSAGWNKKTRPYDGIPELLNRCQDLGLQMTILSNKPDEATQAVVSHFFDQRYFKVVWGARTAVPKKPDPSAALEISHQLKIPSPDFLYLGDTGVDMQTAVSAGMYAAGALWGFREAEELLSSGARILVRHPTDLLAWF